MGRGRRREGGRCKDGKEVEGGRESRKDKGENTHSRDKTKPVTE